MRKVFVGMAVVMGLAVAPLTASAGPVVEGSVGVGWQLTTSVDRTPVNVMVAPGWGFAGLLKLELGLLANMGDVQNSKFDLELRPMVVISPPLIPLYLRGIFAVQNFVNGPTAIAYGAALGLSFGLFGAGLFVEAGVLPRNVKVDATTNARVVGAASSPTKDVFRWFVEGRAGAYYDF